MLPRVLFINRSYWPDTEATGQLLTDLTEDLATQFSVTVVAGLPNHLQPDATMPKAGYDQHGPTNVLRIRHTQFAKHSFLGRIVNLLSFTLSAFWSTLFLPRPDIVVTETDPFFLPLLGRWLKWRYRCRFVAYLQDVYPDVAVAVGKVREGLLTRLLRTLLVRAYRRADRVIVLSECMARRCRDNGVPAEVIRVIPNWVETSVLKPIRDKNRFRSEQQLDGRFVVMYSGNLGVGHLLHPVLEAAEKLKSQSEILFVFIGEGAQKRTLESWCEERRLENVRFLPYQPREFLMQSLSAASVQIVSLHPNVSGCLMPSKLYGVFAAGVPVLAIGPLDSDLSAVVNRERAGVVCNAASPSLADDLVASILQLRENPVETSAMGNRARQVAVNDYDRAIVTGQFAEMLHDVQGNRFLQSRQDS